MNKINLVANRIFVLMIALCFLACNPDRDHFEASHKNILFIMTDDHAFQALSAYDDKLMNTPHLDRIADEGMLFNKSFVTNSICSPSRAVALTGKFSHLNSVRDNVDIFDSSQPTFATILKEEGYQTAVFGKWHLKSEPVGFSNWEVLPGQGHYYKPEFKTQNGLVVEDGYVTDVITNKVLNFFENLWDKSKPFMVMYNHKAPHRDWWPSMDDLDHFHQKKFAVSSTLFDDYKNRGSAAKEAEMRIYDHMALTADNKITPELLDKLNYEEFLSWYTSAYRNNFDRLTDDEKSKWQEVYGPINKEFENNKPIGKALTLWKYQRYLEDYLGSIKSVDDNIGRVLDYLDEQGLSDNTLVIYTSDQGFYLGEHGWFDKRFMYEESFRTPLLIRYPPTIEKGSIDSNLVQNIDLAPTILDFAGLEIPIDMQGLSLMPLLENKEVDWRNELYYHYYEYPGIHMVKRHYGIRTERYKLIHFYYDIDEWELYDLEKDPQELNNVYNSKQYIEVRELLHERLALLRQKYKDSKELDDMFIENDLERRNN